MSLVPRQTVLNVQGLITTPNELGAYPEGACELLENAVIRAPNVWEAARQLQWIGQMGTATEAYYRVMALAAGRYLSFIVQDDYATGWAMRVDGGTATPLVTPTPIDPDGLFDPNGYLQPVKARGRLFVNSRQGVLVLDTLDPSSVAERTLRMAGLPQPTVNQVLSSDGGTITENAICGYQAVFVRVSADGYALRSPPSVPAQIRTGGTKKDIDIRFAWAYDGDIVEGDILELYRSAGFDNTGLPNPETGTSMRRVSAHVITAADVSAKRVWAYDRQPLTPPLYETAGQEIYTSPYQDGSTGANLYPPVARACAQWGDYTFYGNVTDEPTVVLEIPAGIGASNAADVPDLDAFRLNGIGSRQFTGVVTSGSPTITGISAAEIVGVVPGQKWGFTGAFTDSAVVLSVGASTVTLDENSTITDGAYVCAVDDAIEVNGVVRRASSYSGLVYALQTNSTLQVGLEAESTRSVKSSGFGVEYDYGSTVTVRPPRAGVMPEITLRATNGANYSPALPEIDQTVKTYSRTERANVFRWSKQNQPEAVPSGNEGYAGAGEIICMHPTTDQLWILCTDGLRRLTGAAGQWRVDMVDPSVVPVEPGAACVMFDTLYVYTERGIVAVDGAGKRPLTRGMVDELFPGTPFRPGRHVQLLANTTDQELIALQPGATWGAAGTVHVYSTLYQRWSSMAFNTYSSVDCGTMFAPADGSAAYPLFGVPYVSGSTVPDAAVWPKTTLPLTARLRLQPWYASDPMLQKQWVDVTVIVESDASTPSIALYLADELVTSGPVARFNNYDKRATFGIPRNYAINQLLQLGLNITSGSTPARLKGLSVRLVPLTNQPGGRQ